MFKDTQNLNFADKNIEFQNILEICNEIRIKNNNVPIVLMGYMNSFLSLGKSLSNKLFKAGVDGIIVVDLPYDESKFLPHYFLQKSANLAAQIKRFSIFVSFFAIRLFLPSQIHDFAKITKFTKNLLKIYS